MGNPRPYAPFDRSANRTQLSHSSRTNRTADASAWNVRLLLLEAPGSAEGARIEAAAREAGITVTWLDAIESAPASAALVGVGPSVADPLASARHLRAIGSQALLVLFTSTNSARDALQAELVRDPFLCRRFELIQLPDNVHQLASRMGKVASAVKRQLHAPAIARRRRHRSRGPAALFRGNGSAEHVLSHVLSQSRDAFLATDDAGRLVTWNESAWRAFGIKAETAMGRPTGVLDPGEAGPYERLSALVERVLTSGEPHHGEVSTVTAGGTSVVMTAHLAPIRDAQGVLLGVSILLRDDSEFKRVQQALSEANRQKDEFLAIMSHELRTPLTSILGYTDMLLRGLSGPLAPLANKYVGNVRSAGDRLLELVNGLLDYTRLEAGVERLEVRPIELAQIVGQVVQNCETLARSKGVELHLRAGSAFKARVDADEQRIMHVLRSMLNNAVKFTPTGGWVHVEIGPDPQTSAAVRVSVSDSGIGMRPEQVGRVWERFYQGDASLTRPYGGMGLGLSIARHLVTLHGGSVGADSSGPGQGSTFWFSLPRAT